jgi:hypothetical protein
VVSLRYHFFSTPLMDPRAIKYKPSYREAIETASLLIPGETSVPKDYDGDDIPVRLLSSFAIYKLRNRHLVPFEEVDGSGEYGGSGFVQPWIDDNELDDEDGQDSDSDDGDNATRALLRVRLSRVLEVNTHHVESNDDE